MKKINQYTKGLLFATLAVVGLTLTSCKDQPDAYKVADGIPSVYYIRNLSTEVRNNNDATDVHYTNGELVESASPQSTLCLVGDNLRSVYELYFNDCKAVLNTSYITDNTLIVDVPKSVPKEVTNKIYLVNRDGTVVEYPFSVTIPAPNISEMSLEYAVIGDRVTFTGDYFVNYEESPLEVFFTDANGNLVPATINNISDDYTSVEVTIPEGAAEGPVTMTSIYGTGSSAFHYLDSRGLMFNFDNGRRYQGWHEPRYGTEGGINGTYLQLGDGNATMTEDGKWDDSNFSFEYWCGDWNTPQTYPDPQGIRLFDIEGIDLSKPENMILKFEMCIPSSNAWQAGAMQIIFAPTDYVSLGGGTPDVYGDQVKAANNHFFRNAEYLKECDDSYFHDKDPLPRALYRPWTTTGSFDTGGKWITVTIPIASSFVYSFDGSGLTFNLKEKDFASLTMFVVGGGVKGKECQPIIKIDNIRVIPNK
jgi:hypothetical protein